MNLPPLQTQLSGFQWLATQTCFFSIKPTLGNTTILLPQQTNESLTNALQQLYNLFVAPKQQQWEQYCELLAIEMASFLLQRGNLLKN